MPTENDRNPRLGANEDVIRANAEMILPAIVMDLAPNNVINALAIGPNSTTITPTIV